MNKILKILWVIPFLCIFGTAMAADMESTGAGTTHQSDDLAVGDPYQGKTVSAGAEAGPALTQAPYNENCKEARCIRAKQRQKSSPYWGGHTQGKPAPAQGTSAPAE